MFEYKFIPCAWRQKSKLLHRFNLIGKLGNIYQFIFNPRQFTCTHTYISKKAQQTPEIIISLSLSLSTLHRCVCLCREPNFFLSLSFPLIGTFYSLRAPYLLHLIFSPALSLSLFLSFRHVCFLITSPSLSLSLPFISTSSHATCTHHLRCTWNVSSLSDKHSNRIRVSFVTLDRQDGCSILSSHLLFPSLFRLPRSLISPSRSRTVLVSVTCAIAWTESLSFVSVTRSLGVAHPLQWVPPAHVTSHALFSRRLIIRCRIGKRETKDILFFPPPITNFLSN